MQVISHRPPAVHHPDWCSPVHCDSTSGSIDITHSGVPVVVPCEDGVEVSLARCLVDERDHRSGAHLRYTDGVVLRLAGTDLLDESGRPITADVMLTPAEAGDLVATLGRVLPGV